MQFIMNCFSKYWSALFRLVGVSLIITIFRIGRAKHDSVILNLQFFIQLGYQE